MKTKSTLIALFTFLLTTCGNASHFFSNLNIDVAEHPNRTYLIELGDGSVFETEGDISINDLTAGINSIRIFKRVYSSSHPQAKFKEKLIYDGSIKLPLNSNVFTQLIHKNLYVTSILPKTPPRPVYIGMRPDIFLQLKRTIREEGFDKDKLKAMNFACNRHRVSSSQVLELMNLLSFDSYKLKFAKKAYKNTVDKRNYFLVKRGLTFTSNKRKLINYINSCKKSPKKRKKRGRH